MFFRLSGALEGLIGRGEKADIPHMATWQIILVAVLVIALAGLFWARAQEQKSKAK